MKCEYCGKEFTGRKKKYCSRECCYNADVDNKRMKYVWISDRAEKCLLCGGKLGKGKYKFCSDECARKHYNIQTGRLSHSEILTKNCCVCGKEFQTWKSRQTTCSEECKILHRKEYNSKRDKSEQRKAYDRVKYLRKHPDAKTSEQRHEEHLLRLERQKEEQAEKAIAMFLQEVESEPQRAKKIAEEKRLKEANRKYWQEYEAEHECAICGCVFVAHYPLAKYCSKKCSRKVTRIRKRYEGITIDKDITVQKLAKRDHDKCQLCGLPVDWNDKHKTDKAVICGDMYPSIDHIIPISSGGLHAWNNVQLAHRICNTRKSNKVIS